MSDSVRPHRRQPTRLPVPGILQARTLEWVAISFFNAWKWKQKGKSLSHVRLLATPWTAAHQAPPSMGFSRQEYWSGVPLPSPQFTLGELQIYILVPHDIEGRAPLTENASLWSWEPGSLWSISRTSSPSSPGDRWHGDLEPLLQELP